MSAAGEGRGERGERGEGRGERGEGRGERGALFFRSRLFLRWVAVYALLLALPTLVTGVVSFRITTGILEEEAAAASLAAAENGGQQLERVFREVDTLAVLLEYLPWLSRIVALSDDDEERSDRFTPTDMLRIITVLRTYRSRYPAVAEIAVFLKNLDLVVDCEGTADTAAWFGTRYSLYASETGAIGAVDWSDTRELFVPDAEVRKYQTAPVRRVLICRKLPRGSAVPKAAVMFQLDKECLAATLEPFRMLPGGVLAAVTAEGALVQAAGSLEPGLLASILARGEEDRGRVAHAGRTWAYAWAAPGPGRLRFVSIAPVDELLRRAGRVRVAALALLGGALAAGLALAYVTTRANFLPIRELARRLSVEDAPAAGRRMADELAAIASAVDEMSVERQALHRRLDAFLPVVRANLVNRLLDGRTEGIGAEDLEGCGIRFPSGRAVAAIVALREPGPNADGVGRMGLSALVSADIQKHLGTGGRTCYVVERNPFDYRLVLGTDAASAADLRPVFAGLVAGLTSPAGARFAGAAAAVGDPCPAPEGIARSFAEARKALDCHLAAGDREVILYAELSDVIRDEFAFDTESRRRIAAAFAEGDGEAIDALLDGLLANPVMRRRMAARGPYALFELLLHALRTADGLDHRLAQCVNFNELAALPDDAGRIAFCRATFHRLAAAAGGRPGAGEGTIAAIVAHVEASFTDPSLSLTALSDRFGLSPDYISRRFKQRTGANFLEYVNRLRVARAREMLSAPRALIKRVGGAAGFASEVSFRRVFRRYEGMSPGEYRRQALMGTGRGPS